MRNKKDKGKKLMKTAKFFSFIFSNPVTIVLFFLIIVVVVVLIVYTVYSVNTYLDELVNQYVSLTAKTEDSGSQFDKRMFYVVRQADGTTEIVIARKSEVDAEVAEEKINRELEGGDGPTETDTDPPPDTGDLAKTTEAIKKILDDAGVGISGDKLNSIAYLYQAMYLDGPYGYEYTIAVIGRSMLEGTPLQLESSSSADKYAICPNCKQHSYLVDTKAHKDYTEIGKSGKHISNDEICKMHTLYEKNRNLPEGNTGDKLTSKEIDVIIPISSKDIAGWGIGSIQMSTNTSRTACWQALSQFYGDGIIEQSEVLAADYAGLNAWIGGSDKKSTSGFKSLDDYCTAVAVQINGSKSATYNKDVVNALYPKLGKAGYTKVFPTG